MLDNICINNSLPATPIKLLLYIKGINKRENFLDLTLEKMTAAERAGITKACLAENTQGQDFKNHIPKQAPRHAPITLNIVIHFGVLDFEALYLGVQDFT